MSEEKRIYGIDLGTTYSCIAYVDDYGQAVVVPGDNNTLVTPSVVYFEAKSASVVGQTAKDMARIEPNNTIELIKGYMGDETWTTEQFGESYRPEEISCLILKKLAQTVKNQNLPPVTDVVITVPAYFNMQQRTATQQAGELAGLNVQQLIPEPTAAATAYAINQNGDDTFMVYDLGGGTFDVTVMTVKDNDITVVCVSGEDELGGRLWDERLAGFLAQEWQREHGYHDDPLDDPETSQDLYSQSEAAKRDLTQREGKPLLVQHGVNRTRLEITRNKFEELTQDLLQRTILLTRDALDEAKRLGAPEVTKILLVGGSSWMPQVKNKLESEFKLPCQLSEPDQSVAKGAALYAQNVLVQNAYKEVIFKNHPDLTEDDVPWKIVLSKLDSEDGKKVEEEVKSNLPARITYEQMETARDQVITNVCSKNFGVTIFNREENRYYIRYLIRKNDPVSSDGIDGRFEFYTVSDNQRLVESEIIESNGDSLPERIPLKSGDGPDTEYVLPENSKLIGQYVIEDLPPNLPASSPIAVRARLTSDGGRLTINAQEVSSGQKTEVVLNELNAISASEMRYMMSEKAVDVS